MSLATCTSPAWLAALLLVVLETSEVSQPRETRKAPPAWGKELFETYCASCHGTDGRGRGPAAASLNTPPPDLTGIRGRHGGEFPTRWVIDFIDGETQVASHGSREMPVWGRLFRWKAGSGGARAEISALAAYLETIQEK
jgi:mono/diheme cytochrome c family protein